jgi:hypothetical protein
VLFWLCSALVFLHFLIAPPLLAQAPVLPVVQSGSAGEAEAAYEQFLQSNSSQSGEALLRALQAFVQQWPSHAGAMLDLALLHCELGNWQAMNQQFQAMEQQLRLPAGIAELIQLQRQKGCSQHSANSLQGSPRQWLWEASLGYSTNANLATSRRRVDFAPDAPVASLDLASTSRQQADGFGLFSLSGQGPFVRSSEWQLGLTHKQHLDNPWLNHWGLQLGLWQPYTSQGAKPGQAAGAGGPSSGLGLSLSQWWVNNQLQESSVRARLEHWLSPAQYNLGQFGIALAVQRQRFTQDPLFNAKRLEAGLRWFVSQTPNSWLYFGLDAYTDTPSNGRPGGKRQGWLGYGTLSLKNQFGRLSLVGLVQNSKEQEPYNSTFFGNLQRNPSRQQFMVRQSFAVPSADARVFKGHEVEFFLELGIDKATDTIDLFSFSSSTVRAGLKGGW